MIYVNQEQLDQVKYLLEQSALGNHILFHSDTIKTVMKQKKSEAQEKIRVEMAEKQLEKMILCPSISTKKAFLETLDKETYEDVLRVYLNIVQNTAQESQNYKQ